MLGMGEHVYGLNGHYVVTFGENREIASLRGRVAADIDDSFRSGPQYDLGNVRMDAGTRGIKDDDLRAAVFCYERLVKHILHIPGKELAIVYVIGTCVDFGVFYSLRNVFYAYDLFCHP